MGTATRGLDRDAVVVLRVQQIEPRDRRFAQIIECLCVGAIDAIEPAAEEVLLQALSVWREHGEPERMRETQQVLDAALERRTIPWGAETR